MSQNRKNRRRSTELLWKEDNNGKGIRKKLLKTNKDNEKKWKGYGKKENNKKNIEK